MAKRTEESAAPEGRSGTERARQKTPERDFRTDVHDANKKGCGIMPQPLFCRTGAEGGTRTRTASATTPSRSRVYQFHHLVDKKPCTRSCAAWQVFFQSFFRSGRVFFVPARALRETEPGAFSVCNASHFKPYGLPFRGKSVAFPLTLGRAALDASRFTSFNVERLYGRGIFSSVQNGGSMPSPVQARNS